MRCRMISSNPPVVEKEFMMAKNNFVSPRTLAGFYTDRQLPGVGISIGLTRLFYILNEMDYLNREADAPADVLAYP